MSEAEGYYGHVREEILPLIPGGIRRVLELGCGEAATLRVLREREPIEFAAGVDIAAEPLERAGRTLDHREVANLDVWEIPVELGEFDLILCLDVLEHLVDPWRLVAHLHSRLSADGCIVTSLPNIRHRSALFPLFFHGEWKLQDDGILDRTHLRFFTRKSAIELMTGSGLQLQQVESIGAFRGGRWWWLEKLSLGLLRPFNEYQFLLRVGR